MGTYEDSYKSLLQGVSQQIPQARLPGQLTAQDNMLSDPVTGLRRRPGTQLRYSAALTSSTTKLNAWYTEVSSKNVHILHNAQDGNVYVLDESYALQATLAGGSYLQAAVASDVQAAVCNGELFLVNTAVKPTKQAASIAVPSSRRAFVYIKAGAFSKQYEVQVVVDGVSSTVSYTTPDGSTAGDAALATTQYIATKLYDALVLVSGLTVYRDGGYLYMEAGTSLTANTSSGSTYIVASKAYYVNQESDLPARLPSQAGGMVVRVGDLSSPKYFKYDATEQAWLESGDEASPTALLNMPKVLTHSGSWQLVDGTYEGRLAGDDESNEDPPFLEFGITGIAAYQGRLVLLAGPQVSLSASNNPYRFYRSTVSSLLDSDPIHVGSSAATSAAFRYAVAFNKDLLLFSQKYQAVLPAANAAITPRTATVVLTSEYSADMGAKPVNAGRSLLYPVPLSSEYFGFMEMLPSEYTDAQYTSYEATAHIPRYMRGTCRAAAASTVSNISLFLPTANSKSLIVNQYQWSGTEKVQQAWSTWYFPFDIAAVYFSKDVLNIVFYAAGQLMIGSLDTKASSYQTEGIRPFADLFWYGTVNGSGQITVPAALQAQGAYTGKVYAAGSTVSEDLRGEEVTPAVSGGTLTIPESWRAVTSQYVSGYSYRSSFVPTVPMVLDYQGQRVETNKLTLLRYYISTVNSSEYKVLVQDNRYEVVPDPLDVATLFFESSELELGQAPIAGESSAVVPCRTDAKSTTLYVYTDGSRELNITGLEFACRYHQKIGRK